MDSRKGVFSSIYLYSILKLVHAIPFSIAIIWNSWVLSKVTFFSWDGN